MERGGWRRRRRGGAARATVEVAISRSRSPDYHSRSPDGRRSRSSDYVHPNKNRFFTVDFGGNPIHTTYARNDADVARWISDARRIERERRRSGSSLGDLDRTILVGARIARGVMPSWTFIREKGFPRKGKLECAVELISLCVAGSHCLVIELNGNGGSSNYDRRSFPRPLREFLADRFVCVAAVGAWPGAATLRKDWGVHVEWPVELRELFVAAFGRDALRRRRGGGDEELLREMGRLALGGIDAGERRPPGFEEGFWDSALHADEVKYAAADAFLSYKIAEKSLEARGAGNQRLGLKGTPTYLCCIIRQDPSDFVPFLIGSSRRY